MDAQEAIEQCIDRCWDKISKGNDFIYVLQVTDLIHEIENQLKSHSILKQDETKLLQEMIQDKPTLKLYRQGLESFLLKLVKHSSLVRFFTERTGLSKFNIVSVLTNPSTKGQRYSLSPSKLTNTSTPKPSKLYDFNVTNELQIKERELYISAISKENKELQELSKEQALKVRSLERQIQSLKEYAESLEREVKYPQNLGKSGKSQDHIIRDLVNQCNERDKTIKMLENMCEQYQKEFEKLQENSALKNLTANLKEQNQLIASLRHKLKLEESSTNQELSQFLVKIPILKQYLMYFRYKEQHKNLGILTVNVVTIITTCIIIMAFLRIFYFILLSLFSSSNGLNDYIYDTYGISHWPEDRISMVWWKEIDWLEFLIYKVGDWLQ